MKCLTSLLLDLLARAHRIAKSSRSEAFVILFSPVSKLFMKLVQPFGATKGRPFEGSFKSNFVFLPQRAISFGAFLVASCTKELGIFTIELAASTFAPFSTSRLCTFLLGTFILFLAAFSNLFRGRV